MTYKLYANNYCSKLEKKTKVILIILTEMIMKKKLISSSYGIIVLVVLLVRLDVSMGGQSSSSSCLNQLAPCLRYLNGSQDVPDSCCDPLKSVIKSNPECMCSMISNQGSRRAEQAGINVTEAQQLPGKCGQHVNPLVCLSRKYTDNTEN